MNTLQARINEAFNALPSGKQNQVLITQFCGVTKASVNDWFSGKTKSMKAHTLRRAAEYLNVSEEWLISGKGSKEREFPNIIMADIGTRQIPLLNYIQAGNFTGIGQDVDINYAETLLTDLELSDRAFALEIRGKSLLPDFEPGDRVIIACEVCPRPGDFVVAKNDREEATVKKYKLISTSPEVFELVPLNEDYPTMRSDEHSISIIGVEYLANTYKNPS